MKGISTPPTNVKIKVGSFTRDTTLASGTQAVTGVGFRPALVIFFMAQDTAVGEASFGFDDGITKESIVDAYNILAGRWDVAASSISDYQSSSMVYTGSIITLDSDGFTINWTRSSTPSGIITIYYLALK